MADLASTKIYGNLDVLSKLFVHGNVEDDSGNLIYDYSNSYVPESILENNTITVAGNSVSLGNSTSVAYIDLSDTGTSFPIPNSDLSNSSLSVAGNSVSLGGSTSLNIEDLADVLGVSAIKMDTSGNLTAGTPDRLCIEKDTGRVLYDNGTSFVEVGLSESQISLANLGSRSHSDLSDAPVNAHIDNLTDIPTRDHNDLKNISSDDHHTKYSLTDDLSSNEISQIQNINTLSIINTQWGYISSMGAQPIEDITGESISDLSDVTEGSPTDNEIMAYDSGNSDWRNQTSQEAGFHAVATSGDYNDLTNRPDLTSLNDVVVENSKTEFPSTGDSDKVYIAENTGYMYRWNGSDYTQLTDQTAIWGQISGSLSDQTDLQSALNSKLESVDETDLNFDTATQTELNTHTSNTNAHINNLMDIPTRNHNDLNNISMDDHHAGFVGLLDNAGTQVNPDASDLIQLTDDGIVNADAGTNAIGLSISEGNISHDNISDVSTNDHHDPSNQSWEDLGVSQSDITVSDLGTADSNLNMDSSYLMTDLPSPSSGTDVANKNYVDSTAGSSSAVIDAYSSSAQIFDASTEITVDYNTIETNVGGIFSISSGKLTINSSDRYMIVARVSTDQNSGSDRAASKAWIEKWNGSSWQVVPGSYGYMYNRTSPESDNSTTIQVVVNASGGNEYRVRAIGMHTGTTDRHETHPDGCRLTVWSLKGGQPGPAGASSLAGLDDTSISSPTYGEFLYHDGSNWTQTTNIATDTELSSHKSISNAHHNRYSDNEAISAINNDADHGSTASHNYFSGNYNDLANQPSIAYHSTIGLIDLDSKNYANLTNKPSIAYSSTIGLTGLDSYSHNDLQNIGINDHIDNLTDIPTRNHNDLNNISSNDHHQAHIDPSDQSAVGDITDDVPNVIYDYSNHYIPSSILEADSVTIAGNSVSLGSSTTVDYIDLNDTGSSFPIPNSDLSNSSVSVAGNSVSLGGSTSVAYTDLSDTGTSFPIPNADLSNTSITVNAGDKLSGGGSVSLGGSITIDHSTSGAGDINVGTGDVIDSLTFDSDGHVTGTGSRTLDVSNLSGTATDDQIPDVETLSYGSRFAGAQIPWSNVDKDIVDDQGNTIYDYSNQEIDAGVINDSDINHDNIGGVSSADHHTKYTDENAQDAVGTVLGNALSYTDAGPSIDVSEGDISHDNIGGVSSDDHHQSHIDPSDESATGDITDDQGNTIYDYSNQEIDAGVINDADINHDSTSDVTYNNHHGVGKGLTWDGSNDVAMNNTEITVTAGDKLSGGGAVGLGKSITIDHSVTGAGDISISPGSAISSLTIDTDGHITGTSVEHISHDNLTGISSSDHHSKYIDEEAQDAVGLNVGNALSYDDGTGAISVSEGNISHDNISGVSANDHHDPSTLTWGDLGISTSDISASDVGLGNVPNTNIAYSSTIGLTGLDSYNHNNLQNISSDDHHTKTAWKSEIASDESEFSFSNTSYDQKRYFNYINSNQIDPSTLIYQIEGKTNGSMTVGISIDDGSEQSTLSFSSSSYSCQTGTVDISGLSNGKHEIALHATTDGSTSYIRMQEYWVEG